MGEIVVAVDHAALVRGSVDALKHDPNARRQFRELFDVDAIALTTGPAVQHAPRRSGRADRIGRWRPTYDEHEQSGTYVCEAFDSRCAEPPSGCKGAACTATIELVASRIRDLIRGD